MDFVANSARFRGLRLVGASILSFLTGRGYSLGFSGLRGFDLGF